MSRDLQLAWPCPHMTVEEPITLGGDRRSLNTRQPVAASGMVRILANDQLYIPQGGLSVPAQLFGSVSGPYTITAATNTLVVESPYGTQTFTLPTKRQNAQQIVAAMLRQHAAGLLLEDSDGHLALTDTEKVGPESFVRVHGTAAAVLGFGDAASCLHTGYAWRATGQRLYPGWDLVVRPDDITNRFPRFREPLRSNPMLKATYTVPPSRCLRCGGTRVENDFRYDVSGQAILIENEDLLYQAALKMVLTDRGSNPYHAWYGTPLRSRMGSKAVSGIAALISEDVRQGLQRLQSAQKEQARYQTVTYKERFYSLLGVSVSPHVQDPTTYLVSVAIQNASSETINLSIVFTVPSVVALMGSNGLMLGTEQAGLVADQRKTVTIPNGAVSQLNREG